MARTIHLLRDRFPGQPGLDTGVSRALLAGVDSGRLPESFRLFVPDRIVAFGRQDVVRPGYRAAVAAARAAGFTPVERLAGGRAAVFHEATLSFAWCLPDPDPRTRIKDRFTAAADLLIAAFASLGIAAEMGEVPGEYCPGAYSVHAEGRKVMGVGQRLTRKAAHIGGVVVVDRPDLVNLPLGPVYRHLGYEWEPAATGALAGAAPVTVAQVADAVIAALGDRAVVVAREVDAETLAAAQDLASDHVPG